MGLLRKFEEKVYSEHGEDGIIECAFNWIGCKSKTFLEMDVKSSKNNTRRLLDFGWSGMWCGKNVGFSHPKLKIIAFSGWWDIVSQLPTELDLVSTPMTEFWRLSASADFQIKPRILAIPFDGKAESFYEICKTLSCQDSGKDVDISHGLSMGKPKLPASYDLIECDSSGHCAFFIRSDIDGIPRHAMLTTFPHVVEL
jgi:hypothetical protein